MARGGAAGAGETGRAGLGAPARRALRAFLTQRRWFQNGTQNALVGARLDLLRSLPVFERCEPVRDATRASEPRASAAAASFVSLDATPSPLVAPEEASSRLLTSSFLSLDSEDEALVLTKLCRVPRADTVAFFSAHVLPALASGELAGSLAPSALDAAFEAPAPGARVDRRGGPEGARRRARVARVRADARRRFTSPAGSFRPDGSFRIAPRPEPALPGAAVRRGRAPRRFEVARREVDARRGGRARGGEGRRGGVGRRRRREGRALLAYLNALAERTSARANDPGGGGGGGGD